MKKLLLTLSILLFTTFSHAKTYKIFTPGPAGSGSDIIARMIAAQLEVETKDTFVVINKPGASGLVGYKSFLADNQNNDIIYLLGGTTLTLPNMENAFAEFTPIATLYNVHYFVAVRKDSNFKTLKDITGKINVSSSNNASEVLFKNMFSGDIQIINYKSENQTLTALVTKEVDVASVSSQNTVMNSVKDQITVFSPFPKNAINPLGFIMGKNTPDSERDYLNKAVNSALSKPEISKFMQDNFGVKPEGGTPTHFIRLLVGFRQVIIPLAKDAK